MISFMISVVPPKIILIGVPHPALHPVIRAGDLARDLLASAGPLPASGSTVHPRPQTDVQDGSDLAGDVLDV